MYNMENNPGRYYKMINNYQETQLLFSAIRLNVFSLLDQPITAKSIADELKCDEKQIELLLLSLLSCNLVGRQGEFYVNTAETREFLSRNSQVFLGDALLFREKMTSLEHLEKIIKAEDGVQKPTYDFSELAKVSIPEMYTGRVQAFIGEMEQLYPDRNRPLHILDLGGGTGILSIEFVRHFPHSKATVFETPEVAAITKEIICGHNAEANIDVTAGDFNEDSLGGPYDLIIASGILNFVKGELSIFMQKLAAALKNGGHLLVIGRFSSQDYNIPPNMLGWLSGFLDGVPLPPSGREIAETIQKAGLSPVDTVKDNLFEGLVYRKDNADFSVYTGDVILSFIELTEQISNSKTNILDFGSEDMTFYRGEIHMIKMIGDFPGLHSAELARKFGITRPVVHKTLQKLSERGLILREEDSEDKKRSLLYLTEKGQKAYQLHAAYHAKYDKALFDFLADTPGDQLASIKGFLDHAISLIQNHA